VRELVWAAGKWFCFAASASSSASRGSHTQQRPTAYRCTIALAGSSFGRLGSIFAEAIVHSPFPCSTGRPTSIRQHPEESRNPQRKTTRATRALQTYKRHSSTRRHRELRLCGFQSGLLQNDIYLRSSTDKENPLPEGFNKVEITAEHLTRRLVRFAKRILVTIAPGYGISST
jgi:hypothetical protein